MIAYNYYIKYLPTSNTDKKVEGSFIDVVTVIESSCPNICENFSFELQFYNNQGRELSLYTDREFTNTEEGQLWAFEVKDVVTIFWYSGTLALEYIKQDYFTEELLKYWCIHIILPLFFTVEETYDFLHAGAVEVEGNPILFIAESYGGKSTLTDFFLKQGHTMISDDKVATVEKNRQIFAIPSYPRHRPYRKMEDLGYIVKNFAHIPKPIHTIYELEKADKDAEINIKELQDIEKFKSLHHASILNLFFLKAKRFIFLTQMANRIPMYRVSVPWNLERLREVYNRIVEHTKLQMHTPKSPLKTRP